MKKVTYITLMTCVAAGLLGACSDELVPNGGTHNSELVGFTMDCSGDSVKSRSMDSKKPFCGVLAMTSEDNSGDSLYLHTNVMDNPVVVSTDSKKKAVSRGTPVNEANFGDNFYVYAYTNVDNTTRTYMQNIKVTKGSTAWLPESNFYWTENDLDFFAYHGDDQSKISSLNHNIVYSSNADDVKKQASFSYTVPKSNDNTTDATVQPDIMMSFNSCGKSDYAGVAPLKFSHALSAVKFELDVPITGKIKTVTIEGIYGTGTCVYDGAKVLSTKDDTSDDYVWTTSGSTVSYTQSFDQAIDKADVEGDKTIKLDGDKEQFTFMLIPQTIPSTAKVKVVMWDSENNVEHTFTGTISDGSAKWLPGKTYTYIISRNAVVWEYIFEVTPSVDFKLVDATTGNYSVTSYKRTASVGQTIPLKWSITNFADVPQVVDEDGVASDNGTGVNSTSAPAWFSAFTNAGEGNVTNNEIVIVPQKIVTDYAGDKTMQEAALKGSDASPWDLSTHRHGGATRARCTANCYIVHSAGTYMIPLVYGNAIYNGAANPSSYTYQSTGKETNSQYIVGNANVTGAATRYNFQDHVIKSDVNAADGAGDGITQPYISKLDGGKYDVKDAVMLWQDAYNIVKQGSVGLCKTEDGKQALKFTLNKDFMQQGNIVLAVRDANGTILWSWHIWVYDHNFNVYYELANYEGKLGNAGTKAYTGTFKFATGNLGQCMAKTIKIPAHKANVTFTQYEIDGTTPCTVTKEMIVTLQGLNFKETVGNNTYYQFGRKDPMIGVQNRVDNLKTLYTDQTIMPNVDTDPDLSNDTRKYGYKVIKKRVTIAETIQNPHVFFSDGDNQMTLDTHPSSTYAERDYHNRRIDDWVLGPGERSSAQETGREVGYVNLWNNFDYSHHNSCFMIPSTNTACDEYNEKVDNNNTKVVKTVYDPCPVGYKMPAAAAFRSIGTFGRGSWHPLYVSGEENSGGVESIETITAADYSTKYIYPIIWKNGSLNPAYNYAQDNKFNGGYQSFTEEGGVATHRFYINAIGASFSSGGDATKMSIEATGQRYFGRRAGNGVIGVSNLSPTDVYLWTGDVLTSTNTFKFGNIGVSLFIQQNVDYQSGFKSDSQFPAAKAMARPVRPMWDEDYSDNLR